MHPRSTKAVLTGSMLLFAGAAAALLAAPAIAADCRSNVECDPPVTTAVVVAGLAGENDWWRSDVTAALDCVDASGCAKSKYSLDQADFLLYEAPFDVAGEGLHSVEAFSEDKVGNLERYPALTMIRIDATAPQVALTRPTAGNVYVANVEDAVDEALPATVVVDELTVEAANMDGLSGAGRVEFHVDGVLRAVRHAAPYTWVWPAGDEAAGDHEVTVTGFDIAGNQASASLVVTTVPTTLEGLQATADLAQEEADALVDEAMGMVPSAPDLPSPSEV